MEYLRDMVKYENKINSYDKIIIITDEELIRRMKEGE